jgi:hypothetical protein
MPAPSVQQLHELALADPVVQACMANWRAGLYPTFESMLVALAVAQTEAKLRVTAELTRHYLTTPRPTIVEGGK